MYITVKVREEERELTKNNVISTVVQTCSLRVGQLHDHDWRILLRNHVAAWLHNDYDAIL